MVKLPNEQTTRSLSDDPRPGILMIAGFGDNSSMYDALHGTELAKAYCLVPFDMPGFGAPALRGRTSLHALSECVLIEARRNRAHIIMAHSVASVVAAKAAAASNGDISCILSLEGNLTADDAYFSGTAADYDGPEKFRSAFLSRLELMAKEDAILARYRREVESADPVALWELGCDARRYSEACVPGEELQSAALVHYFYNPVNCPQTSISWLENNGMPRSILADASHWAPIDQPDPLARQVTNSLERLLH
ncbi:alpha/beta hydrolase [Pseudovibrio exalbescens]|uniref:alpha/beta fold hydrolase n=1 Tax=Pseudovibrio exalbescens TaxID=197461 RepID=UPI00236601F5|nr:alpha/beta hydrolase [Pseudovibrio exalbescens]MDD7908327.1 alpha/beta hydrolase [Pseudovibrio exalbescens]